MAAAAEMGEIEEVLSSKEDDTVMNGDFSAADDSENSRDSLKEANQEPSSASDAISLIKIDSVVSNCNSSEIDNDNTENNCGDDSGGEEEVREIVDDDDDVEINQKDDDNGSRKKNEVSNGNNIDDSVEIHEIIDDDDEEEEEEEENASHEEMNGVNQEQNETIELNDSGPEDVMIIEENDEAPKENGSVGKKRRLSEELEVIELDAAPPKKKPDNKPPPPTRRSVRNINKTKVYVDKKSDQNSSEESDIEEILPQDPLDVGNDKLEITRRSSKPPSSMNSNSSTIVVKDTKRLVEIAAKSNNSQSGKKEPTLVIIDTNSILSGRGPVPVNKNPPAQPVHTQPYSTLLPMALPAQGMYPPNMRATITPIPMTTSSNSTSKNSASSNPIASSLSASVSVTSASPASSASSTTLAPVLPTLTDDMFVVEAPSFIVPYVYEKPPVADFKNFVKEVADKIREQEKEKEQKEKGDDKKDGDKSSKDDDDGKSEKSESNNSNNTNKDKNNVNNNDDDDCKIEDDLDDKKPYSYFESPLGKFFIDIGFNLVQEYVQSDLLKQQKRKRDREGGNNPTTNKTIHSLLKDLEFSKENNEPFKTPMKKCEFCNFKTESMLAMAHHLETPHTKNYVYKCNFCPYEVRSPHDILFHMEAEHTIRGRLERAPAFHQCPNCPFEDNQKGKLSRHLVACMRKFKPERNLEPPIDWEPPAKIPRVPKQRQGLNVSAYQAMKSSQLQFLSKMQLLNTQSTHPMHRGRGRPTLTGPNVKPQQLMRPSSGGMVYKPQQMSGGSVLVPTNYQLSGNQVFQVVGGQELGGRLGHPGQMAFVPNVPSASSTITIQQNQSKNKSMHQPSISITPLPRSSSSTSSSSSNTNINSKPGDTNSKNSFVICEICDGYIKDLEQLRNHMQWIHKVKIHPKMIYNRPPLNCQKCQFRFFTDQGLERHLLGSHGLVTSSMQDAANKSKDAGRCPVCGRVYQWKLLNHVARDHNMTLKPAHLSYKCTVCTATFGMYKQFENHVYSAHSVVAKRVMDKKNSSSSSSSSSKNDQLMKPLKINDEITIIPQPAKSSKEGSPLSTGSANSRNTTPSTSKNADTTTLNNSTTTATTTTTTPSTATTSTSENLTSVSKVSE